MEAFTFSTLAEGTERSFEVSFDSRDIDQFAASSGDDSPLHMQSDFAKNRGFKTRVVHGLFLGSLISRLVGTLLPGENALIQQVQLTFHAAAYIEDRVRVEGKVIRKSEAMHTIQIEARITKLNDAPERLLVTGKVQVGFTEQRQSDRHF
jgi:3-hydroxybutyryl-CoA dehydratase